MMKPLIMILYMREIWKQSHGVLLNTVFTVWICFLSTTWEQLTVFLLQHSVWNVFKLMSKCCHTTCLCVLVRAHLTDFALDLIKCVWAVHLWAKLTVVMSQKQSVIQEVNSRCHMWLRLGRKSECYTGLTNVCLSTTTASLAREMIGAVIVTDRQAADSVKNPFKRQRTQLTDGAVDQVRVVKEGERSWETWRDRWTEEQMYSEEKSKVEQKGIKQRQVCVVCYLRLPLLVAYLRWLQM